VAAAAAVIVFVVVGEDVGGGDDGRPFVGDLVGGAVVGAAASASPDGEDAASSWTGRGPDEGTTVNGDDDVLWIVLLQVELVPSLLMPDDSDEDADGDDAVVLVIVPSLLPEAEEDKDDGEGTGQEASQEVVADVRK
jgi:hypothetical protein